jgi:hypothetical protein
VILFGPYVLLIVWLGVALMGALPTFLLGCSGLLTYPLIWLANPKIFSISQDNARGRSLGFRCSQFGGAGAAAARYAGLLKAWSRAGVDIVEDGTLIALPHDRPVCGLARKLPHYGKYSWLVFNGDAPDNEAKGEWLTCQSPLVHDFEPQTGAGSLPVRRPLADLPPAAAARLQ